MKQIFHHLTKRKSTVKTNFYSHVIVVAIAMAFSGSALAGVDYIRNEPNKKVISAPHFFEFDKQENKPGYGWCGHTALKSAMSAYGYTWDLQSIHKKALEIDPKGSKYGYKRNNSECRGYGYCAELNLLKDIATSFGFSTSRGNAYNEQQLFDGVKQAIDDGRVIVALSRTFNNGTHSSTSWTNIGHFYTIHGYRVENGVKYFYMRDPRTQYGGYHTDIHEIPVSTWWKQMKRNQGSGDYVGYFSIKK